MIQGLRHDFRARAMKTPSTKRNERIVSFGFGFGSLSQGLPGIGPAQNGRIAAIFFSVIEGETGSRLQGWHVARRLEFSALKECRLLLRSRCPKRTFPRACWIAIRDDL